MRWEIPTPNNPCWSLKLVWESELSMFNSAFKDPCYMLEFWKAPSSFKLIFSLSFLIRMACIFPSLSCLPIIIVYGYCLLISWTNWEVNVKIGFCWVGGIIGWGLSSIVPEFGNSQVAEVTK